MLKNRKMITLSVKPETAEKLKELADKNNRPVGRELDIIIENYSKKF